MVSGEEAKVEPLTQLGPGFGFKLGLGIGGDDSTGVRRSTEGPKAKLGHGCGFGNAVAGGDSFLDCLVEVEDADLDSVH